MDPRSESNPRPASTSSTHKCYEGYLIYHNGDLDRTWNCGCDLLLLGMYTFWFRGPVARINATHVIFHFDLNQLVVAMCGRRLPRVTQQDLNSRQYIEATSASYPPYHITDMYVER